METPTASLSTAAVLKRAEFQWRKFAVFADFEAADFDGSDACADQFQDLGAKRFDHAAYLTVAAFGDGDFKEGVAGGVADAGNDGGAGGAVFELDASAQMVELLVGEQGGGFDQVGFGDFGIGAHDVVGEIGVVGHEEKAGGVEVEAADGDDPFSEVIEEIVDGRAIFGIFEGGEVALRFVEEEVDLFCFSDGAAVEGDLIAGGIDPVTGGLDLFTVDGDAAGSDPLAGLGAGGETGLGEDTVEGFEFGLGFGGQVL